MNFINSSPKFRYAIDQLHQLEEFFIKHPELRGLAFVGRSNVGKSSLINSLFGKKTANTSKTPGRTQKINIFSFTLKIEDEYHEYALFDLPGYGHAEVSKQMKKNWNQLMTIFFERLPNKVKLICIQDARHPNQKSDQQFKKFLGSTDLNCSIVLNKIDKLKTQKEKAALNKVAKLLLKEYPNIQDISKLSATSKQGVEELERNLYEFLTQ